MKPWVRVRYQILLEEFGDKEFTKRGAAEVLKRRGKPLENLNDLFNRLNKAGLIEMRSEGTNFYYKLKKPEPNTKVEPTRDQIKSILKMGADIIRNQDYRVLLILLFYKALSDKWQAKARDYFEETSNWEAAYYLANRDYHVLYDEKEKELYTWEETLKNRVNLVGEFLNSINKIADLNSDKLSDIKILAEKVGIRTFLSNPDMELIFRDLVETFNQLDLSNVTQDIIGWGYEWILSYFAPTKAKAGEVYTPREVIKLMVNILDIKPNSDVLDPACGSAAMLIEAYKYVSENYNDGKTLKLIGQELNDVTEILGKLNLVMHGVPNFEIYHGDSLANPRFGIADYVIANPPWNLDYNIEPKLNDKLREIYKYGITPKQSADWLWVQLMLYHAKTKVAVILDSGALFRGGKERAIRKKVIEDDLIEAVILLPEKLFYNTGAPGIIMILNKNKPKERKGKILFINASKEFEKHPDVRRLNILSDKNISKIVEAYRSFSDSEGFSRAVSIDEILKNDFNLNVTLYVSQEEPEEEIDVFKEWAELEKIEKDLTDVEAKLKDYLEMVR